ncbi:TolC family protein [Aquabacterium sp.]|uniref:TolC family protein n=1 Tax=Aquabacterium sp. TaxID=1872578 RepID=UPI0025BE5BB6|nr:TolC family protein [Aquabacterium sp.]
MSKHTLPPSRLAGLAWLCLAGLALPIHAQVMPAPANTQAAAPPASPSAAPTSTETVRVLSLDELITTVVANNTELLSAQQARVTATAGIQTATAYANPRLEWQSGRNQARMPGAVPGSVQGWGVSQMIENPGARDARRGAAEAAARGTEHAITLTRNAVVSETRLRASEYLLRRAEAGVTSEDLALLEQVRERVRLRVASGEAPRYEVIKADAEIVHARERQQTAALQAEQVLLTLNRMASGRLPARWSLAGSLQEDNPLPSLAELMAQAETDNPELRALQAEVERAEAQVRGARASRWPGVELRVGQTREPDLRHSSVGVSVQIPLLDQRDGAIGEAGSELRRLQGRLDGRRAELRQQLQHAWQALAIARLRVQALSEGVVLDAEAALKVAQAAYRFGERGILDVLDAQRVLRSARLNLLEARFQSQAARIELETLAGRFAASPTTPQ